MVYGLTTQAMLYVLDMLYILANILCVETLKVVKIGELREFGEYRTGRLVLEAWDGIAGVWGAA